MALVMAFNRYNKLLQTHPIVTKCITNGLLFSLGDYFTQKYILKAETFDLRRNLILTFIGTVYYGPSFHYWYCKVLPKLGKKILPKKMSKIKQVFGLMMIDQVLFGTVADTGFFMINSILQNITQPIRKQQIEKQHISAFTLLEKRFNKGAVTGVQQIKQKLLKTLMLDWTIWPAASMINFYYVKMQYRVLYVSCVSIVWNAILSYLAYE